MEQLQGRWIELQQHVNYLIDSDLDKVNTDKIPGIRQVRCIAKYFP